MQLNALNTQQFVIRKQKDSFRLKIRDKLFSVVILLSKSNSTLLSIEKISVVFQLLQLLVFAFNINFSSLWKQTFLFEHLSIIVKYFQIIPFFENNKIIYLIAFYSTTLFFLLLMALILYYFISNNQKESCLISLLRISIPFITTSIYIPILILFTSILSCNEGINTYVSSIPCFKGISILHSVIGIIMTILFIVFSFFFISLDFNSDTNNKVASNEENIKINSDCDVKFFIGKTILVLVHTVLNKLNEDEPWIVIAFSLFISGYVFFDYYYKKPYVNEVMMKYYFALTSLFLWSNICLFIAKVFAQSAFDGAVPLFIIGIPIILVFIITSDTQNFDLFINHQRKKKEELLHSILKLQMVIDTRDKVREARILFDGYVSLCEEKCTNSQCPLKHFVNQTLKHMNMNKALNDNDSRDKNVYLYQHIESLYANSIMKYPTSSLLRLSFAFFLLFQMNKKNRAMIELANAEKYSMSLQDSFKIYKYKTMILNGELLSSFDLSDEIKDSIEYKKQFNIFKGLIRKVAVYYIDFWGVLLLSNKDDKDNLARLNSIGKCITHSVDEISNQFDTLQKMKYNDKDTIMCYTDFLLNVINDKDKAASLRCSFESIRDKGNNTMQNGDSYNINANSLSFSDEAQYLVISSQPESFGFINNISLGLCSLFGYSKTEIIGKNYECLLPELFVKQHRTIVISKADELRKKLANYYQYKDIHTQPNTFAINRLKYLIPINVIVGIIPNESNDFYFIAKIISLSHHPNLNSEQSNLKQNMNSIECYVLTDNNLVIQHFTPNSVSYLDLDSKSTNANYGINTYNSSNEITDYIREFTEEYLIYMIDLEDKSPENKILVKLNMLKKKFSNPSVITWRRSRKECIDRIFKMTLIEQKMLGRRIGFVFQLEFIEETIEINLASNKSLANSRSNYNLINVYNSIQYPSLVDKVEKEYVPESNTKFNLDPVTMSYHWFNEAQKFQKEGHAKYLSHLQSLALKKVNMTNNKKGDVHMRSSEGSDSDSYTNSNDNSNSNDNESNDDDIDTSQLNNSNEDQLKYDANATANTNAKAKTSLSFNKQKEDLYYKVNSSCIKFFIIDYKRQAFIEHEQYDKTSQVELKLNEDYKEKTANNSTNTSSSNDISKQRLNKNNPKSKQDQGSNHFDADSSKEFNHLTNQTDIILQQIQSALKLKESQPTIIRLQQLTFWVILSLLGIGSGFIAVIVYSHSDISATSLAIENTYDIIMTMIMAQFKVREITLLNNSNISVAYGTKEDKFALIQEDLLNLFNTCNTKINQIVTTTMHMSSDAHYHLNEKTIPVYIIQNNTQFTVESFQLSLKAAFIEINTALFHISTGNLTKLITTNPDVNFYLRNGMNDVFTEIKALVIVLLNELNLNLSRIQLLDLIPFAVSFIVLVLSFIFFNSFYQAVLKRKDSYLEVFFEISKAHIQSSLETCEYFNKKIQCDTSSDTISDTLIEESIELVEMIDMNQIEANPINRIAPDAKKRRNKQSNELKIIQKKIAAGLSVLMLNFILVFSFFWYYLNTIGLLFDIYQNSLEYQMSNCCVINYLREYLYDSTMPIYNITPGTDYLEDVIRNIYVLLKQKTDMITSHIEIYESSFIALYDSIYEGDVCSYGEAYFTRANISCADFLAGSAQYGLVVLLSTFIEEIRYVRNAYNIDQTTRLKENLVYNMTLYGTKAFFNNWPLEEENPSKYYRLMEYLPIKTFNLKANEHINAVFTYFLFPTSFDLIANMKLCIDTSMSKHRFVFIPVVGCYMGIVLMFYLIVLIPFNQGLNQTIYKTKNMLKIIPGFVLYLIPNILTVLDIGSFKINNEAGINMN